jgi:hypothetical protein
MADDNVTWWKDNAENRNQNDQDPGTEIPGDTDAADIVGRTGEEMPEVAHDAGYGEHPKDNVDSITPQGVVRKSDR